MRIVIDCNVLISGYLWPGVPNQLLIQLAESSHHLFTSDELLAEFRRVLHYPKITKIITQAGLDTEAILDGYSKRCLRCYPVPLLTPVCRDPSDDHVLACALAANAELIISGDDDLLSLQQFQNIPIVMPADAIEWLKVR